MPHEFEWRVAYLAGLSVAPVDEIIELKIAGLASRVDEIAQRRTTRSYGFGEHGFYFAYEPLVARQRDAVGSAIRVNACAK